MAEQQLRQDKYGCYYWADPEPEPEQTVAPVESATVLDKLAASAEAEVAAVIGMPTPPTVLTLPTTAPAKRTRNRSPRKAADSVVIPPPPPIIRG